MTCDRCNKEIKDKVTLAIAGEHEDDVGTDLNLCRDCGESATLLIGDWVASGTVIQSV
jgi:hypothetical protein